MRAKRYNHSSLRICECFIDTALELNVPFLYLFHTKTASSHQTLLLECPSALDTHENSWCSNWLELETFGAKSSWTTQQQPQNLFTEWWTLSSTFLYPFELNSSFVCGNELRQTCGSVIPPIWPRSSMCVFRNKLRDSITVQWCIPSIQSWIILMLVITGVYHILWMYVNKQKCT